MHCYIDVCSRGLQVGEGYKYLSFLEKDAFKHIEPLIFPCEKRAFPFILVASFSYFALSQAGPMLQELTFLSRKWRILNCFKNGFFHYLNSQ